MNVVQMSVEKRIITKEHPARITNPDIILGQDVFVPESLAQVTLNGIIGLREHHFGRGVRTISALYVTTDEAQQEANRLWDEYITNTGIVYRFTTREPESIKLITTEISLGTRNSIYPSSLIVAKIANIMQLTENHVRHYPNQS